MAKRRSPIRRLGGTQEQHAKRTETHYTTGILKSRVNAAVDGNRCREAFDNMMALNEAEGGYAVEFSYSGKPFPKHDTSTEKKFVSSCVFVQNPNRQLGGTVSEHSARAKLQADTALSDLQKAAAHSDLNQCRQAYPWLSTSAFHMGESDIEEDHASGGYLPEKVRKRAEIVRTNFKRACVNPNGTKALSGARRRSRRK